MNPVPRIAFFTDSYHDVNGVSRTSQQFVHFAGKHNIPLLSARAAPKTSFFQEGSVSVLELKRFPLSIALDDDLKFDPFMQRHSKHAGNLVRKFRPDVMHITSPGDMGILGAWIAHKLNIPIVAAWQTNLHEFAASRLDRMLSIIPRSWRKPVTKRAEDGILAGVLRFYKAARAILVPNNDLLAMVGRRTGRPCFIMRRGIDTDQFSPSFRNRNNQVFRIGYVGRIRPEKNVRMLRDLEQALMDRGAGYFQFYIVGDGSERRWLEQNMRRAEFTGVLRGEALSRAYADMDAFVFPSRTDTFGNVVLEAMASGLPAIVTDCGGPKSIVRNGETGFIAPDLDGFCDAVSTLMRNPPLCNQMALKARAHALETSWDSIFYDVLKAYEILWHTAAQTDGSKSRSPYASDGAATLSALQINEDSHNSQFL